MKKLNEQFYDIDISFIDEFIDLVDKEGFNISHEMLYKFEILTKGDSYNVLRILESNNFEDGIDYTLQLEGKGPEGRHKNIYILSSDAFKMICMKSLKTKKYTQYFILLEKAIKYYNQYQIQKLKIKIQSICEDRVLKLQDIEKSECFVILKNSEFKNYPYSVIRGQQRNLNKTLTKLSKTNDDIICRIPCCYANNLYNKIKENLSDYISFQKKYLFLNKNGDVVECSFEPDSMINEYNHVTITRNINIFGVSIDKFIEDIELIDNNRYKI